MSRLTRPRAAVSPDKAARRMGLTLDQFVDCRRRLYARGFPVPDETTGLYDIEAINRWRMRQRPDLYPEVQPGLSAVSLVIGQRRLYPSEPV